MARIAGSDSAKTKASICEKALALSAQSGFEALTMRAIAAAAGVQVAAIYHYFPDKQSLLAHLLNDHFDRLLQAASALPRMDTARVRLLSFARFHLEYHTNNRPQTLLAAQELRSLSRPNAGVVLPKRQAYERQLRQILADGVSEKAFEVPDLNLSCTALLAMLTEIAIWLRPGGKLSVQDLHDGYAVCALKMVSSHK